MTRPSIPTLPVYTSPIFKMTPAEFIERYEDSGVDYFQLGTPYLSDDPDGWLHREMSQWLSGYRRQGGTMRPMLGLRPDLVTTRLDADVVYSGVREVNVHRANPFALNTSLDVEGWRFIQLRDAGWSVVTPSAQVLQGTLRYAYPNSSTRTLTLRSVHASPIRPTSEIMAHHWLAHAEAIDFATGLYPDLYVGTKRHLHVSFDYARFATAREWAEGESGSMPWRFPLPGPEYDDAGPFIRPPYTGQEYDAHVQDVTEIILGVPYVACAVLEENPWGWPGGQRTRWMRSPFYDRVAVDVWGADARTVS